MAQDPSTAEASLDPDGETCQIKVTGQARFSPEEEKALLEESAQKKAKANELFNSGDCQEALVQYEEALSSCPDYKHFERAVIHSNMAACRLNLEEWDAAIKAASKSLDALLTLEREVGLIPPEAEEHPAKAKADKDIVSSSETREKTESATEAEKVDAGSTVQVEEPFVPLDVPEAIKKDIERIRIKALLRRGRARSEAGGWNHLSGAQDDYKTLSQIPGLTRADAKTVRTQLVVLPPRTKAAQEKETSEMWGKLRQLGDGILKPFGLSTNNFQMVKDEATGGYSMNFQGNQGS